MKEQYHIVAALLLLLPAAVARGNELKLTPSLSVQQEYNDNILYSSDNAKGDFVSRLSPALEFSDRSERLDAALSVRGTGIVYAKGNGPDSLDQDYAARMRYVTSPRSAISCQAGFGVDSQPDRDINATGLVIDAVKRRRQRYSVGAEGTLTEKVGAQLTYSYEQDDYDKERVADLEYHEVTLTVNHALGRLLRATQGSVVFDYAHYLSTSATSSASAGVLTKAAYASRVDNYSVSIGVSSAFNEIWSIRGNVGGRYTVTDFSVGQGVFFGGVPLGEDASRYSDREWGVVGELGVVYSGERSSAGLSFSTDVMPSSGQTSGTAVRTSVVANASRRFTADLSGALTVGYYRNTSDSGAAVGEKLDQDTVIVAPSVHYQVTKDISLEGSYQYSRIFNNVAHVDADRNSVFVKLIVQHPFFM